MRGEVEHGRGLAVKADGHDHVAELGKSRICQDAFDVILLNGNDGCEQRCKSANARDNTECVRARHV